MWRHGRRHGVGKFLDKHGWSYRGQWEDGLRQGNGVLSSTMGHRFSGTWKQHHLPHGTLTGRFLGTYNGHFKATDKPEWPCVRCCRPLERGWLIVPLACVLLLACFPRLACFPPLACVRLPLAKCPCQVLPLPSC